MSRLALFALCALSTPLSALAGDDVAYTAYSGVRQLTDLPDDMADGSWDSADVAAHIQGGEVADDFVLLQAETVTGMRWWALSVTAPETDDPSWFARYRISFYADDPSGTPGELIATRYAETTVQSHGVSGNQVALDVYFDAVELDPLVRYWVSVESRSPSHVWGLPYAHTTAYAPIQYHPAMARTQVNRLDTSPWAPAHDAGGSGNVGLIYEFLTGMQTETATCDGGSDAPEILAAIDAQTSTLQESLQESLAGVATEEDLNYLGQWVAAVGYSVVDVQTSVETLAYQQMGIAAGVGSANASLSDLEKVADQYLPQLFDGQKALAVEIARVGGDLQVAQDALDDLTLQFVAVDAALADAAEQATIRDIQSRFDAKARPRGSDLTDEGIERVGDVARDNVKVYASLGFDTRASEISLREAEVALAADDRFAAYVAFGKAYLQAGR